MSGRTTAIVLALLMVTSVATIGAAAQTGDGAVRTQGDTLDRAEEPRDDARGGADRRGDDRDSGRADGDDDRDQRDRSRSDGTDDGDDDRGEETTGDDVDRPGVPYSVTLPPDPTPTLTQPNGVSFDARFWSEKLTAGWRTTDGYTVVEGDDGYWHYATREDGALAPTGARVGLDPVPSALSKGVAPAGPTESGTQAVAGPSTDADVGTDAAPSTGTAKFPVVMINFQDTSTSYTTSEFQSLLFGDNPSIASGPGSVTDYYEEASYGQLTVTGSVFGWVTANKDQAYYGEGGIRDPGCCFNASELVTEAAQKVDGSVDFSEYDNDGDGVVDQFVVIHQGAGQEVSGNAEDIWSHKFSIDYTTNDGVEIDGYVIQPEEYSESRDSQSTIGVFAHEFGHGFGLPDLYDTDYSSEGIGNWGLMASGSYGEVSRSGDAPNHMTAWSKEYMNWIDPPEVTLGEVQNGVSLGNVAENNDYYKILNETNNKNGEYFYVANRQQIGFDQGLPGEGVMVTHINESKITAENCIFSNDCNDDEANKLVDVEAADGAGDLDIGDNRGDAGDLWTAGDAFSDTSTPSSKFNNGTSTDVTVDSISFSGSTATLDISAGTSSVTLLDQQWSYATDGGSQYATPAVSSDRVFLGGLDDTITAVDRASGAVDWTFDRAGSLADSSPVYDSGTVYVGSGGGEVYALDATTGTADWSYGTDSAVVSTPAVTGTGVYVGSNDGTILALYANNGTARWTFEAGSAVYSTVETGGGSVYVTLNNGSVLSLDQATGDRQWIFDAGDDLGHSSPAYDSGTVYVSGSDYVYSIDAGTGTSNWQTFYSGTAGSSPTVDSGTLYLGTQNGTLHALDASTGSTTWSYIAGATIGSTPAVYNDRVVFGSDAETIYLLDATNGDELKIVTTAGLVRSSPTIAGGTVYIGSNSGQTVALANIQQ